MTTNAGARELAGARHRLRRPRRPRSAGKKALEQALQPGVPQPARRASCSSRRSSPRSIERVVDKFVMELDAQLNAKKVFLSTHAGGALASWPRRATTASSARGPMARLIQNEIKQAAGRRDPLRPTAERRQASRSTAPTARSRSATSRRARKPRRRNRSSGSLSALQVLVPVRRAGTCDQDQKPGQEPTPRYPTARSAAAARRRAGSQAAEWRRTCRAP